MSNFNQELIAKAKEAKTKEELLTIAKENGEDITAEQADTYFELLNKISGELADEDLDNVAGGGGSNEIAPSPPCPRCGSDNTTGSYLNPLKGYIEYKCLNCHNFYRYNHTIA
ncbi:MAG: hypothetical protein ACERKN_16090 [Velocimicrobium sp.]